MSAPERDMSLAAIEARLGPIVVAAANRIVDAAPPLTVEQREALRRIFASAQRRAAQRQATAKSKPATRTEAA